MRNVAVSLILVGLLSACSAGSTSQPTPTPAPGEQRVAPAHPPSPNCRALRDCPDRIRNLSRSDLISLATAVASESSHLSFAKSDDTKMALVAAMTVHAFEEVMPQFGLEENDLPGGGWEILVGEIAQSSVADFKKPKLDFDSLEKKLATDFQ